MIRKISALILLLFILIISGCVPGTQVKEEDFIFKYDVSAENLQGINNIYLQEKQNRVWFTSSNQGFISYNTSTKQWEMFDLKRGLISLSLTCFAVSDDEVWIGTDTGAMHLKPGQIRPKNFFGSTNNLLSQRINWIEIDNDVIWIATPKGATAWVRNPDVLLSVSQVSTAIDKDWIKFRKTEGLISNNILIIKATKDMIFFGTNSGLSILNKSYQEFKSYTKQSGHLPNNFITDIIIDEPYIWFATLEGLARYHTKFENWEKFTISNGLPSNIIIDMVNTPDVLYVLTQEGLGKYDKNLNIWRTLLTKPFILNGDFTSLAIHENFVYVGTSNGIYYSHADDTYYRRVNIDGTDISSNIMSITSDNDGIWYSSDKGTYHIIKIKKPETSLPTE